MNPVSTVTGILTLVLSASAAAGKPAEENHASFDEAVLGSQTNISFRYRIEHVADDDFNQDADASTLRLRLNHGTGKWRGWSGAIEFDYVAEIVFDDFNSSAGTSSPRRDQFPAVADPNGADLNQLFIEYEDIPGAKIRIGRQRILADNQRFVGGVGWRQNEQTYDGVTGTYERLPRTRLSYSYLGRVNRIFGDRTAAGQHDVDVHLLNGEIEIGNGWQIGPYYYDIDNDDVPGFSTATLGAYTKGRVCLGKAALKMRAEYATQKDTANNPVDFSSQYFHLSGEWTLDSGISFGVGLESLGGDQLAVGEAFRTPLATLHAFQGWADQFLVTPDQGVDDVFVAAKFDLGEWKLQSIYHAFSAAEGSAKWGSEIDLAASRRYGNRYSLLLKAALFDAEDAPFVDANKFWVQLTGDY